VATNRRISEFPEIAGTTIDESDLLTLVHVFEVDPVLRNKKITFSGFRDYLNQYYVSSSDDVIINGNLTVAGTTNVTTITASDLATFSGVFVQNNLETLGTISGLTVTGDTGQFSNITGVSGIFTSSLSGETVTGTNANFTTGTFDTIVAGSYAVTGNLPVSGDLSVEGSGYFSSGVQITGTLSGTTITGSTAQFTQITGQSGVFTSQVSGVTITGTTIQASNLTGVSGTFTSRISGATITGDNVSAINITGISGVYTSVLSGATVTGSTGNFTNLNAYNITGFTNISGAFVRGTLGEFDVLEAVSGLFTTELSGLVVTGDTGSFTELTGVSGVFTSQVSGSTVTGDLAQFTTITGNTAGFTTVTGTTVTGTSVLGSVITGVTGVFTSELSGETITGTTANFTSGNFVDLLANNLSFGGSQTVSGDFTVISGLFVSGQSYFASGVSVTGDISGQTITGTTANFTSGNFVNLFANNLSFAGDQTISGNFIVLSGLFISGQSYFASDISVTGDITGSTLAITTPSGATAAIVCSGVVSGGTGGFVIQGPLVILP